MYICMNRHLTIDLTLHSTWVSMQMMYLAADTAEFNSRITGRVTTTNNNHSLVPVAVRVSGNTEYEIHSVRNEDNGNALRKGIR